MGSFDLYLQSNQQRAIKSEFNMKQFWKEVLLLPYKSNSQDNPLHERQVEELLIKHGFRYIAQPNGIQASPDFRVFLGAVSYTHLTLPTKA